MLIRRRAFMLLVMTLHSITTARLEEAFFTPGFDIRL